VKEQSNRSVLAIIPARGGSKGIPRKNLVCLAGRPLLGYTIEHAQQAASVTRIVVSTDSPEIGEFAAANSAEVVWRPPEISGDTASSESALLHVLGELERIEKYTPQLIVFLQATSPLRRPCHIEESIGQFDREGADSLFSAYRLHGFLWRATEGNPSPLSYDFQRRPRRQEAPEDLVENGAIYLMKHWVIKRLGCRLGGRVSVYRMPADDSLQVDEPKDLPLIEHLLDLRKREVEGVGRPDELSL
jgi:CMP-N,N'-diacetyllegionaminic acid synthase